MFSFDLPVNTVLTATAPDGTIFALLHAGAGRFLTSTPPIAFMGLSRDPGTPPPPAAVTWDGVTFAGDSDATSVLHTFDVHGAYEAVQSAAAAGDAYARVIMGRIEAAAPDVEGALAGAEPALVESEGALAAESEGGTHD